jgi:hypothetical protein
MAVFPSNFIKRLLAVQNTTEPTLFHHKNDLGSHQKSVVLGSAGGLLFVGLTEFAPLQPYRTRPEPAPAFLGLCLGVSSETDAPC